MHVCMNIHTYVYIYIYTHTHTHTHTHTVNIHQQHLADDDDAFRALVGEEESFECGGSVEEFVGKEDEEGTRHEQVHLGHP
jgi:hypothetical protein